ncbi:Major facilitator superfamily domain, general substrate transporter [Niveomyces insectorum RCEF 264]|uniref:Major facilitator superfamily domain, general substrate transporter n=1 Tax=Niveomyces insectorum RCEF 264 TaxID=1081102 RepID=A0A168ACF6_9HYPO|nr:Major facilitator superfamily domain, general substrate transporter [Niveomyces insectorum RCEF 264]
MDIIRDSAIGSLLRLTDSGRRLLKFPEERDGFRLPQVFLDDSPIRQGNKNAESTYGSADSELAAQGAQELESGAVGTQKPTVTWYSDHDPENPHNWPVGKKIWVSVLLAAYSFAAYLGSSIYTPSTAGIEQHFSVSETVASLGLSLFVFGYGVAPLVFSPLSEIPVIGRNPPYVITFSLFAVLTIPAVLIDNLPGILVIRFLLGVLCSPALATVGASYGDYISPAYSGYMITVWASCAALAPSLAPLIAGFAVENENWRWSFWELLWIAVPVAVVMALTLPETSADTLLLRRARRLRKLTGRTDLKSESEIRQQEMHVGRVAFNALAKPWQINALDPAVLFTTVYMALAYGTYYSFFESFPLVFGGIYGFDLGAIGLAFICALTGMLIASVVIVAYHYLVMSRRFEKSSAPPPPEEQLWLGLFASFLLPVGLFIFAWTARADIHWVVCMVGVAIAMCGIIIITQAVLNYLPFTYPRYAGSLFAANTASRCLFAGAAVLFSPPLFRGLGVGGGVSLIAGLSVLCVFGLFGLYFYGADLRRRSKFAVT